MNFEGRISYRYREIFYYSKWIVCGLGFLIGAIWWVLRMIDLTQADILLGILFVGHGVLWILKKNEQSKDDAYWDKKSVELKNEVSTDTSSKESL